MTPRVVKAVLAFLTGVLAVWCWGNIATERTVTYDLDIVPPQVLRDYAPPWIVATTAAVAVFLILVVDVALRPAAPEPDALAPAVVDPAAPGPDLSGPPGTAPAGPAETAPPGPRP